MAAPEASVAASMWQTIGEAIAGIGVGIAVVYNLVRGKKEEPDQKPATHMVMEAASLADMRPILDAIDKVLLAEDAQTITLKGIAITQSEILAEMRMQAKEARERHSMDERDEMMELRMKSLLTQLARGEREPR